MQNEERINGLENQVRTLKRIVYGFGCLLVAGVVVSATSMQTVPDVIQAKKFEVVNDEGKVLVRMNSEFHQGTLYGLITTQNDKGHRLVELNVSEFGVSEFGGAVVTKNEKGQILVQLNATTNGGSVVTENGKGQRLVQLATTKDGGVLAINNKDGKTISRLGSNEDGGALGIFNKDGKIVAGIKASTDGGVLATMDNKGEITSRLPEKITTVSVCRNCVEDKIDISNPSTKGKMIQAILAGADSRYNLHSESDCQSSE